MVCNKKLPQELMIIGILTSLILSVLSFINVPSIYEVEYVINLCLGFLVVMILLAYAGNKKHLSNILLLFSSFSILNILYIFIFKANLFLLFNIILNFSIFSCALSKPKQKKNKIYTIEKAYSVESVEDAKIFVEDSKGNKTDIETAIKKKKSKKKSTSKKVASKKSTTKKVTPKKTKKKVTPKKTSSKKKASKK